MMKKLRAGVIGMGFIGVSHLEAIRRLAFAELVAVSDVRHDLARRKAEEYQVPKCYASMDELLADGEIDVVHDCTPNNLHLEVNEKIIKAGKHRVPLHRGHRLPLAGHRPDRARR